MNGKWCIVVKLGGKSVGLLNAMPVVGLTITADYATTLWYESEAAAKEAAVGFTLEGSGTVYGAELEPCAFAAVPTAHEHSCAKLAHKLTSSGGDVLGVIRNMGRTVTKLAEEEQKSDKKHDEFMRKYKDPV